MCVGARRIHANKDVLPDQSAGAVTSFTMERTPNAKSADTGVCFYRFEGVLRRQGLRTNGLTIVAELSSRIHNVPALKPSNRP